MNSDFPLIFLLARYSFANSLCFSPHLRWQKSYLERLIRMHNEQMFPTSLYATLNDCQKSPHPPCLSLNILMLHNGYNSFATSSRCAVPPRPPSPNQLDCRERERFSFRLCGVVFGPLIHFVFTILVINMCYTLFKFQ